MEKSTFEDILAKNGRLVYTNVGVSMLPLIREGRDILVIEKRDGYVFKKYDVVLFKRKNISGRGKYVLHRIIRLLPDGKYFIVGDNCTSGEVVDAEQILGVLTSLLRSEKQNNLNSLKYKLYVHFWCAPYHLRFLILHIKHFISYLFGAVLYKLKIRR